ncbi:hypothetical protein GQ457_11G023370 [Hibiscus cannabinus]
MSATTLVYSRFCLYISWRERANLRGTTAYSSDYTHRVLTPYFAVIKTNTTHMLKCIRYFEAWVVCMLLAICLPLVLALAKLNYTLSFGVLSWDLISFSSSKFIRPSDGKRLEHQKWDKWNLQSSCAFPKELHPCTPCLLQLHQLVVLLGEAFMVSLMVAPGHAFSFPSLYFTSLQDQLLHMIRSQIHHVVRSMVVIHLPDDDIVGSDNY